MRSSPSFHYQLGAKISIDLALGCKLGNATGGAFRDFDHQTEIFHVFHDFSSFFFFSFHFYM